jgi:hypothetical protein
VALKNADQAAYQSPGGEAAGAKQKPRFLLCDLVASNGADARCWSGLCIFNVKLP